VSVDLSAHFAGWDTVRGALGEIRSSHGELEAFFTGMFDQLEALWGQVRSRERQLAAASDESRRQTNTATVEHAQQVQHLLEETRQQRSELRGAQEAIHGHVARLAAVAAELSQSQASQQQGLADRQRAELETELDSVRGRAAEMAESLAEQKRLFARQQAEWCEELKRMRGLMETMSEKLARGIPAASAAAPAPAVPAKEDASAADPVLDSVLAQFEILQREASRRRIA
jgi:hypothetical protein